VQVSKKNLPGPQQPVFRGLWLLHFDNQIRPLENGRVNVERYWKLSYKTAEPVPTENEAAERLRELMADAVRMRLVSDVPLGVLLSGGVDSSTVAALAVRASSEAVKTFSISFAEASFDESAYARGVAKFLGTDHHEERLSANLAANLVSEIGAWMDEPFSDPSLKLVRRHTLEVFAGESTGGVMPVFSTARVTRYNVAVLASLAMGPGCPDSAKVLTKVLENKTQLTWMPVTGAVTPSGIVRLRSTF